jgi:predicted acetyltransferase
MNGRKYLSGLLCLLLLAMPVSAMAATQQLTITEEQLISLDKNFERLQNLIEASKLTTTESAKLIVSLQERLARADALQVQSAIIIERMKIDLEKQAISLQTVNELQAKYEKETKAKISSLRRDRTLWEIVAGAAVVGAIYSAVK